MSKKELFDYIRGNMFVSCQGTCAKGNPFYTPERLLLMAKAAYRGGCIGFRANTPEIISLIKRVYPDVPMIGIWKQYTFGNDVYITPSMREVDRIAEIGCEIIALDGTHRKNADGEYAWEIIPKVKAKYPNIAIMADIGTIEDAKYSYEAGADIIATTMSGYTENTADKTDTCDFQLIKDIRSMYPDIFIIAEGRIWTREDAQAAMDCGADSIVVGSAVTDPQCITQRFVKHLNAHK
ncbi:MAG: N-acetylmannosamine-6-phosphate 2-epimerase [Erysipelotrichaceae bacterium]|uniref:N-acylglucosamine-6-phosphate 2-epimerase n=1 Tax=Copranaerobaculum intestinale TaxID=2692629 RepID=A0A6N8U7J8_9FIRM|nr:N-acetylmannosamine-6-phosphate 2-epimerase [Copranaerobaculum intestinale]MBS6373029.1 N-acetylmannosamine-6-phosphate 2-epimerase [Erysipelotrichaceae bacterium]MXQ73304.1 putative N-acetylmannosamine-6-phosphate 2-epimerase [Copranaerobaculum intestinale]